MESATFRRSLSERGRAFEAGSHAVHAHGHAYVTARRGARRARLPDVGAHRTLDPRVVRRFVDELGSS